MSIVAKIKELYATFPCAATDFCSQGYPYTLDKMFLNLEQTLPADICFESQNESEDKSKDWSFNLSLVLGCLPAAQIIKNFGENALLWTWLRAVFMEKADELREEISHNTGRNSSILERARIALWQKSIGSYDVSTFNKAYKLLKLTEQTISKINLADVLKISAKKGVIISSKKLDKYDLEVICVGNKWPEGYSTQYRWKEVKDGLFYSIFLDSPIGVCLKYEGLPNAVVSFFPKRADSLLIYQMQGLRGYHSLPGFKAEPANHARGLAVLDHLLFSVNCACEIAREFGFKKIGIQSGHNNRWTREVQKDGTIHLPLDNAIKIYDGAAKNLGFSQEYDKNWYKNL